MPCCRAPAPWSGATAPGMPHCARRHRGPERALEANHVAHDVKVYADGANLPQRPRQAAMSSLAKVLGRLSGSTYHEPSAIEHPLPHRRLLRRAPRQRRGSPADDVGGRGSGWRPSVPWALPGPPGCTPSSSPIRPRAPPPERSCSPSHRPRSPSSEPEPPSRSGFCQPRTPAVARPTMSSLWRKNRLRSTAGDDESQPGPLRRGRTHQSAIGIDRPNTRGTLNDRADPTTTCRGRRGESSDPRSWRRATTRQWRGPRVTRPPHRR